MISRWKAALIFSAAPLVLSASAAAEAIRAVEYSGNRAVSSSEIARMSFVRPGVQFSDSLVSREVARIDSLYFSVGILAVRLTADTTRSAEGVAVRFDVEEGERARMASISVSGAAAVGDVEARRLIRPAEGESFDPFLLERSLAALLERYNESGYPYAQIWLTGFTYRAEANEIDIAVSVSEAELASIARLVFEGLAKTDSAVVARTSRLRSGSVYRRSDVERGRAYLASSGLFETVGEARLERRGAGAVDLVIPVKEVRGAGTFQGAVGFSRRADGGQVASGAASLALRNIAGSGRRANLDWLNNGESYSRIALRYREPFVLSLPFSAEVDVTQVVQDSSYVYSAGSLAFGIPLGPAATVFAGIAGDRNIPDRGDLARSVRRRIRLGLSRAGGDSHAVVLGVEGAYRKRYWSDGRSERDAELLYDLEASVSISTFEEQSVYLRLASRGVFSKGGVPLAETYPLGGANTLRGYREAQFRGAKIIWGGAEYRFGAGGLFFLFDDVGAYEWPDGEWTLKNGAGFGLRADSPVGIVSLSFGVGERLSLSETRLHISLIERF